MIRQSMMTLLLIISLIILCRGSDTTLQDRIGGKYTMVTTIKINVKVNHPFKEFTLSIKESATLKQVINQINQDHSIDLILSQGWQYYKNDNNDHIKWTDSLMNDHGFLDGDTLQVRKIGHTQINVEFQGMIQSITILNREPFAATLFTEIQKSFNPNLPSDQQIFLFPAGGIIFVGSDTYALTSSSISGSTVLNGEKSAIDYALQRGDTLIMKRNNPLRINVVSESQSASVTFTLGELQTIRDLKVNIATNGVLGSPIIPDQFLYRSNEENNQIPDSVHQTLFQLKFKDQDSLYLRIPTEISLTIVSEIVDQNGINEVEQTVGPILTDLFFVDLRKMITLQPSEGMNSILVSSDKTVAYNDDRQLIDFNLKDGFKIKQIFVPDANFVAEESEGIF